MSALLFWVKDKVFHLNERWNYDRTYTPGTDKEHKLLNKISIQELEINGVRKANEILKEQLHGTKQAAVSTYGTNNTYAVIITELYSMCVSASFIINKKKSKKGSSVEMAEDWLDRFEDLKALYKIDETVGSDK